MSDKYCPILTNTSMESLFIQLSDDVYILIFFFFKLTHVTGFVVQGHINLSD